MQSSSLRSDRGDFDQMAQLEQHAAHRGRILHLDHVLVMPQPDRFERAAVIRRMADAALDLLDAQLAAISVALRLLLGVLASWRLRPGLARHAPPPTPGPCTRPPRPRSPARPP